MKAIERLMEYLDYKAINKSTFEKKIAVSNGYLGTQMKRKADLGEGVFSKILNNSLDMNPEWLLTGKGDMLRNMSMVAEPTNTYFLKTDLKTDLQSIPLYDFKASAGLINLFNEHPNVIDYISIPNLPKCDGAISITGDSMYPLLKAGDIIIYKVVPNMIDSIFFGEMYLLSYNMHGDDMTLVKFIQRSDKGPEYIRIVSQNSHHAPKDIKIKQVKALALVKASIRINTMA